MSLSKVAKSSLLKNKKVEEGEYWPCVSHVILGDSFLILLKFIDAGTPGLK